MLAEPWGQVGYYDISERYVVWSQFRGASGSTGRDIAYHDLETGLTGWVEPSAAHYTYWVATSGDHLIYVSSEIYDWEPYSLNLYTISTGEATVLVSDDYAFPGGYIEGNLINWSTAMYSGMQESLPIDSVIYDLRTGISRRLTTRSSTMGVGHISFPYMIVGQWLGISQSNNTDYYIADLVKLGVTDSEGNLLPGDPVLDPPPGASPP